MSTEDRILQVLQGLGPMTVRQLANALSIHQQTARWKANGLVILGKAIAHKSIDDSRVKVYEAVE